MTDSTLPKREVNQADAFEWLREHTGAADALVVVLPDAMEVGMEVNDWAGWFGNAASACFEAAHGKPKVFVQTDRLYNGQWIDKHLLIDNQRGFESLTWHKVALRRDPEKIDIHRPTWSHMLAYGGRPGVRLPDVVYSGRPLWRDGVGVRTSRFIMRWLEMNGVRSILNPFCGVGTLLAAANERGMDSMGCDLDEERVQLARSVTITSELSY